MDSVHNFVTPQYLLPRQDIPGLNVNSTAVEKASSQSAGQFAASLVTGIVLFAVQFFVFLLLKDRFARIYQPRTYLVPERERTAPPPPGWFYWAKAVLSTSNSDFVQRCGLDAYFFLRYLRTLLKIFIPAACVMLPVLIPINAIGGRGSAWAVGRDRNDAQTNVTGLNQLAWGNVQPSKTRRYWAHWSMAVLLVIWVSFVAYDELRNYIRMRQAYMTSPQHRLRASATTVLVSSIPEKWCTVEALDGLYDVFPGGIRNIWLNRNFDALSEKVTQRDKLALQLESAETDLIKKCYKKNEEDIAKANKAAGKKLTKEEKKQTDLDKDEKARTQAETGGITTNDPHQVKHTIHEALGEDADSSSSSSSDDEDEAENGQKKRRIIPVPIIGEGVHAVTDGLTKVRQNILGGIRSVNRGVNNTIDTTNGFVQPEETNVKTTHHHHCHPQHQLDTPISPEYDGIPQATRQRPSLDNDRRPLAATTPISPTTAHTLPEQPEKTEKSKTKMEKVKGMIGLGGKGPLDDIEYPAAFKEEFEMDKNDAVWRKYINEKDRETHRLPIVSWMFALPLIGQKVDTIYYCRKELARLNTEIEDDQAHPERFPLMNSAFIQFNHQVAAHMACQTVSHHLPKQMAPRLVEIDPNDVIWDNMSIPWWQDYIRTTVVVAIVCGMIVLWAIPIALTSALSQLTALAHTYTWLEWILRLPSWFISFLQGVLPIAMLGLLMFLLPLILRSLARLQGTKSGMLIELSVQKYYFFFIFVQLFLVVSVGSAISQLAKAFTSVEKLAGIPQLIGQTIPTSSNYFFSYMLLQGLSVSAGALLQVGSLVVWFILAPILDSTARSKFNRQTNLSNIQWGTFFPVYTNLACIGIIYAVVSPLILIFDIVAFSLFWFVYRYNTLYVTRFTRDTGGLLYPNAINLTFVGLYVMELALIGLFFLVRDENDDVACTGQAIGMIVVIVLTGIYQLLLNNAFSPLFRYLPITLEDDAVARDEQFARAMKSKYGRKSHDRLIEHEREDEDIEDQLKENERRSLDEDERTHDIEMKRIADDQRRRTGSDTTDVPEYHFQNPEISLDADRESRGLRFGRKIKEKTEHALPVPASLTRTLSKREHRKSSWADRDNVRNRRSSHFGQSYHASASRDREDSSTRRSSNSPHTTHDQLHSEKHIRHHKKHAREISDPARALQVINDFNPLAGNVKDVEAQRMKRNELADALYSGVNDELEDLTPEQRDALVQRAFQHSALRARRPVIWLPRDELGVSDDEVRRMGEMSNALWVSNVRQGLDSKGRCVYSGAPPDFSEVDLIQL